MPIEFVDFESARNRDGLRLVVVPGVPSPWGEAAKGILHVKRIPYAAVRLDVSNAELVAWAGEASGPVAIYGDEPPRGGWAEILLLAEHLAPEPALLPRDPAERALVFGLGHEICGEMGLGWARRLAGVHAGLEGGPGFPKPVAQYLADKYGYRESEGPRYTPRVCSLLEMLTARLHAQAAAGSGFYVGNALTAVDLYSAAFMALFQPLPPAQCPMPDAMREAFTASDDATLKALDPVLLDHRDRIYAEFLELPLSL